MDDIRRQDREKKPEKTDKQAGISGNSPISPVKEFDVGDAEEDRRIFQNGDTDREPDRHL